MLNHNDVLSILKVKIRLAGSQQNYAKNCGVSGAFLSNVLNGKSRPGPKILRDLDLKRIIMYEKYNIMDRYKRAHGAIPHKGTERPAEEIIRDLRDEIYP